MILKPSLSCHLEYFWAAVPPPYCEHDLLCGSVTPFGIATWVPKPKPFPWPTTFTSNNYIPSESLYSRNSWKTGCIHVLSTNHSHRLPSLSFHQHCLCWGHQGPPCGQTQWTPLTSYLTSQQCSNTADHSLLETLSVSQFSVTPKLPGWFSNLRGHTFSVCFALCFTVEHCCVPELAFLLHPYILLRDGLTQLPRLKGHLHVADSRIYISNPGPGNLRLTHPIANLMSSFEYPIGISNITCLKQNSKYSPKTYS